MILWDVQQFEIEKIRFDISSFRDLVTHRQENIRHLVNHLIIRVLLSDGVFPTGQRNIDRFRRQLLIEFLGMDQGFLLLIALLDDLSCPVDRGPKSRLLGCRNFPHPAHEGTDAPFLRKEFCEKGGQRHFVANRLKLF